MTLCYDPTQFLTYKSSFFISKPSKHWTKTEGFIPTPFWGVSGSWTRVGGLKRVLDPFLRRFHCILKKSGASAHHVPVKDKRS
jgi:hypothetical protein